MRMSRKAMDTAVPPLFSVQVHFAESREDLLNYIQKKGAETKESDSTYYYILPNYIESPSPGVGRGALQGGLCEERPGLQVPDTFGSSWPQMTHQRHWLSPAAKMVAPLGKCI